jgi:LEA14-like dessication related protein
MPRIAALALAAALLFGCAGVEDAIPPRISLANLSLEKPGLLRQDLILDVRIGNPNNFEIPLEGLTLQLEIDGQGFAEGYSNERLTVPRLGEAAVQMRAYADTISIIRQIMSLGQREEIRYRISGFAYVSNATASRRVPYEREGKLTLLPQPPARAPTRTPDRITLVPST